jgi:hypothetical protein
MLWIHTTTSPSAKTAAGPTLLKGKNMNTKKELIEKIILARQFLVCLLYRSLVLDTKEGEKKRRRKEKKTVYENHTVIE